MTDNLTKSQRSYCMSRIRSSKTFPEAVIKKKFHGFKYQPKLFGKPDFADSKNKVAIFVDGCFWHKCPKHFKRPKSNKDYWKEKIKRNIIRDKKVNLEYKNKGWKIIRIWEHELR